VVDGLIALVIVLAGASAAGLVMRRRQGRFRAVRPAVPRVADGATDGVTDGATRAAAPGRAAAAEGVLSAADLGAPLGAQATLVQFSTEVCAYCGPTRELLTAVARERDGVSFIEIDAAERMDLTRRLHVLSTPTVLVLDADGGIASRASGPLRKADLLTAVGAVTEVGGQP